MRTTATVSRSICIAVFCFGLGLSSQSKPGHASSESDGLSRNELQALANGGQPVRFEPVRENPPVDGVRREVVTFEVDGLHQYALVLRPAGPAPGNGWPVLIYNHGYHPDPLQYGRVATGRSDRPGDYYRGVPLAYARGGYVVVVPDYRGHNDSAGAGFTRSALAEFWYTRDTIAAYLALDSLPGVDPGRVYMTGHSMGGPVTQRALLALGERIRAASIWSSSAEQPLPYLLLRALPEGAVDDTGETRKPTLDGMRRELMDTQGGATLEDLTAQPALARLQVPLAIHHARDDATTPLSGSLAVAARLYMAGLPYGLYLYESDEHLFTGDDLRLAIERDLAWFASYP